MGYKIAIVKPGTTPTTANVHQATNEAGTQTTLASVTHIWIEATEGFKIDDSIDNGIKRYVNKGAIGIPQRKIYRTFVFNRVKLGNMEDDSTARNRYLFLEYAKAEWPKLSGKVSPLYFFNTSDGSEWTTSYAGGTPALFGTYRSSAYTRSSVMIEKGPISVDDFWNVFIDQLVVTEVWS